uniref:Putative ovule protein n=1 Tax=Solanum chacoense TaxID=4108 RepID=A0A0V0GUZ5_SOLCH
MYFLGKKYINNTHLAETNHVPFVSFTHKGIRCRKSELYLLFLRVWKFQQWQSAKFMNFSDLSKE